MIYFLLIAAVVLEVTSPFKAYEFSLRLQPIHEYLRV